MIPKIDKSKNQQDKTYRQMTKKERTALKRTIAAQNKKLANLEKKGLAKTSAAYRYLEAQYEGGASFLYKNKAGNIRFKSGISKMSSSALSKVKQEAQGFKQAQTSTIKGTKQYKQNLENSYNKMLAAKGINKRVKAKDIKELHESALYKKVHTMYGSGDAVKIIEYAEETGNAKYFENLINTGKISVSDPMDPDDVIRLLDTHKEYEQAARGVRGITQKELSDIVVDYAVFDLMSPEEFQDIVYWAEDHRERGETIKELVDYAIRQRYF